MSHFASLTAQSPSPGMIIPFALLLVLIAVLPLIHKSFWEKAYPVIALGLGGVTASYYLIYLRDWVTPFHALNEYFSFICLIGSLYIVTGGVHIETQGQSTPVQSTLFLGAGVLLSNIIGTTGASMLFIRPWIAMNRDRISSYHLVFFIFTVSNCGGGLTPIGDPPLFLGYLSGIPFFWTVRYLWPAWLTVNLSLLMIFWFCDHRRFAQVSGNKQLTGVGLQRWQAKGLFNLGFVGIILCGILLPAPWSQLVMIGGACGSYFMTPSSVHRANRFSFHPVIEVAWLFAGIFLTMMPALAFLESHARDLPIKTGFHYYLITGALSGILDNAPTYLSLLTTALAQNSLHLGNPADVLQALTQHPQIVVGISLGAVFFGAMTYIGNGPNFMVKSIAEQAGVKAPHFFAYLLRYSLPLLLPLLLLAGWILIH